MRLFAGKSTRTRFDLLACFLCLASLLVCCAFAMHSAWRWPLVGDASLTHYVVFLLHSSKAPYSQIVEINLPGSYLLDALAMHLFGWGAHGLRLYDGFLCLAVCVSATLLGNRNRRDCLFCLAGSLLFVLIHLQDGFEQAGQRDFALAALVLCALCLLVGPAKATLWSVFAFELLIGFTLTVKPTLAPMALLPLLLSPLLRPHTHRKSVTFALTALAGLATPVAIMFLWLHHYGSTRAFLNTMRTIGVLHSHLGRKDAAFLLAHCTSPIVVLFILWIAILALRRFQVTREEKLLLFAALCGFLSYLEQGKGFPYQRYPFLAVAIILLFLGFSNTSRTQGLPRLLALAGLLYSAFWLAPRFTALIRSFDDVAPFQQSLQQTLSAIPPPQTIQCLDTYGGCINTLYNLRTVQATRYLYDCYLFTGASEVRDNYRSDFLKAFLNARPGVVVVTDKPCFSPARDFNRIATWPELDQILADRYRLASEWHANRRYKSWSRPEEPVAYRVYIRK